MNEEILTISFLLSLGLWTSELFDKIQTLTYQLYFCFTNGHWARCSDNSRQNFNYASRKRFRETAKRLMMSELFLTSLAGTLIHRRFSSVQKANDWKPQLNCFCCWTQQRLSWFQALIYVHRYFHQPFFKLFFFAKLIKKMFCVHAETSSKHSKKSKKIQIFSSDFLLITSLFLWRLKRQNRRLK